MANVYSLVCWGGANGKSVTVSSSTDLVTLTNHGLRDATGMAFTSGTLPTVSGTALVLNTTYYSKSISSSTYELYYDSALTSKIDFTSTGSSLIMKSSYYLGLSDKSRWTYSSVEYIFDSVYTWYSTRSASAVGTVGEVCEIGEAFTDHMGANAVNFAVDAAIWEVTTKVNGVRSSGFHNGSFLEGYTATRNNNATTLFLVNTPRVSLEGFRFQNPGAVTGIGVTSPYCSITNMQLFGMFPSTTSAIGISLTGSAADVANCVIAGFQNGVYSYNGGRGNRVLNSTFFGNVNAFYHNNTTQYTYLYNNISIGNTTNWPVWSMQVDCSNNIGESDGAGGYVAGTPIGSNPAAMLTSDFVNYSGTGTAPNWTVSPNLQPASATSPQTDYGTEYYGILGFDVADAVRPSYENGTATYHDAGAYEYDHGYGPWPTDDYYGLAFTGLVAGSKVKVFTTGTDTELFSTANSGTGETWSVNSSSSATIDYVILKAGYEPIRVTGITVTGGPDGILDVPVEQVIARWYQASSGLTIDTNFFANPSTKKFGLTTASTLQNLASYLMEQWIALGDEGEGFANEPFPISANGPNSFSWESGWEADLTTYSATITNLSRDGMRYLDTSGNVTASWAAILSVGVPSGARVRYQQTDGGTTQDAAVSSGNMDQLVQIYGDASHGNFDYTGYLVLKVQEQGYDQASADAVSLYGTLEDQLYVVGLSPTANGVAADNPVISDVTITDHGASPVTWNSKAFSITITDAGTTTGEDVMQAIRYAQETGGTFQGKDAFNWHDLVQTNGDKFKGVRGAVYGDTGATLKGVRVLRGADAHPDFTLHTADDGTTVSTTPPAQATATILADSRIQLYNVTTATELDNSFQTGTGYANTLTSGVSVGDTLRLRVCKLGYQEAEAFGVWTSTGCPFIVSQSVDSVYAAWGIDGSTVTEFAPDTTGHIYIESDDPDGVSSKARFGAYFNHLLTTEGGIRYYYGGVTFLSTAAIRVNSSIVDLLIENVNATTALRFSDVDVRLYRDDGTSIIAPTSYSIHNDYSGVPDVVETGTSGLTTAESNQLFGLPDASGNASATLAAMNAAPPKVNLWNVRSQELVGDGSATPWGPA